MRRGQNDGRCLRAWGALRAARPGPWVTELAAATVTGRGTVERCSVERLACGVAPPTTPQFVWCLRPTGVLV